MSQHGGEQAGPDFLSAVGDDGQAGAVIQSGVAALAALAVKPHGHAARTSDLACISHHPTAEARDTTARTSLRLLAVLNVPSSTPARAKRLAPRPDGPLTHFISPRGEKYRLGDPLYEFPPRHEYIIVKQKRHQILACISHHPTVEAHDKRP